jgi:hypothetical protein
MPSNIIKVNNGGKGFEWNVPDRKMDELLKHLNDNGDPFVEPPDTACRIDPGEFECGDTKLVITGSEEYTKLQVNGKYDFFFNLDGSFDGIGIDMPDAAEQEEFRKRMMEDESPVECVTKGPDDYVRTHQ